ncbi:MAG: chitobiase/beta-hexosaminidase C-terminal domain-containing protein [Paludibacteraceae bacterium]|nr:chitobiase/beta-hexosaminidase C-terminal domain-containing protein [Paludibacteraceae bacterium]
MKKLTSILAALFFAITAVFAADNSKTIEVDLAAGTSAGFGNSVRLEWKDADKTYRIQQQKGTGTTTSLIKDNVASPILEGGQYFVFTTSTNVIDEYKQITSISITYDGENYGDLTIGSAYSSSTGVVTLNPLFNANLSTTSNGTHTFTIAGGGATDVYIQNKKDASSLKVTKITFTVNTPVDPEQEETQTDTATVTSMQEVIAALGTRTKVVVLYKNLKPITKTSGQFFDDYMPDGTTKLNMGGYTLPADFDCYGTLVAADNKFTVDSIVGLHAFANLYLLKNYYESNKTDANILNPLNITEPVVVSGVDGNNVFVQYAYARIDNNMFNDHLVINGEHSLKVGDKIASFTAKYNKSTSLTLDEENTVLVRNAYFSVEATSIGATTADNTVKYKALSSIRNIANQAASAAQLPAGGIVVKNNNNYFYTIGTESLQLRPATGVDLESFVGKEMTLSIKGIVDYCNTAEQANAFIVNSIKEINTNYETISQWLRAASEGEGEGSLKFPVVVTHSEYRNYKQYIFIGDATGGLCLVGSDTTSYKHIKTGYTLSNISGRLDFSTTTKAPQLTIPNNITIVDTLGTLEPVEVTIAELLAEENDAINNGKPAIKYANRLVKIRQAKRSTSWLKNNARLYGLIQSNDTLPYASNTLNAYHTVFSTTTPMSVTGIVDFRCINSSNLYSIYPRSVEDIKDDFEQPVISPEPGTYYGEELEITITCSDPAMTNIYYTFDPEIDPTLDECETYEGPFSITKDTTIWYAVEYGDRYSEVYSASYKVRPESEKVVSATWDIEEGATIESFVSVTVTFAGIDSVGRQLDGVEVQKAVAQGSSTNTLFYSVAEDGTRTPVAGGNGLMSVKTNGLSITYSVTADKGYNLIDGKFMPKGNYCIVIDAGDVLFTPNRTSPLPKVYNDREYVLNFTIENDYKEEVDPVEIEVAFTADPADNSVVTSLSSFVLTFTDKTPIAIAEVGETPRPDAWPFLNQVMTGNEDDELGETIGGLSQAVAPMNCELTEGSSIRFTIASEFIGGATEITTDGSYTLTIPAGLIVFSETEINKAITLNYTVKGTGVNVEVVTTENIYTIDGTIVAEGEFQIFTVTGQDVTNMNGRLANGIYVVRTANSVNKVIIK